MQFLAVWRGQNGDGDVGGGAEGFQPGAEWVKRAGGNIHVTENVDEAARNADVLYTDVWVSMGKEAEATERLKTLAPYQLNASVLPASQGRGAGDALSSGVYRQGDQRRSVQRESEDHFRSGRESVARAEGDHGTAGEAALGHERRPLEF
jgi:hypothetical protein